MPHPDPDLDGMTEQELQLFFAQDPAREETVANILESLDLTTRIDRRNAVRPYVVRLIKRIIKDHIAQFIGETKGTYAERINALAAEAVAIWPTVRGEVRMMKYVAISAVKDALRKVARQAAYERRDEIEKLKRKLCVYENYVQPLKDARGFDSYDARGLARSIRNDIQDIDAEPVATLE